MVDKAFGAAGNEVVVEEFLTGPEMSVFALSDGYSTVLLPPAQDHKLIGEGDTVQYRWRGQCLLRACVQTICLVRRG